MKRLFDIFLAVIGILAFAIPLLVVICLVRIYIGRPIFFRQLRTGLNGNTFVIWKFRTMTEQCDSYGDLMPDAIRLTRFGRFLRASSLDELPELWNVLKGDMSMVGPRPLLAEYLPLYNAEQARRHDVRPGITGWAQINGRNAISWDERLKLDVWYLDNNSLWLDIRILFITVRKVLIREGISALSEATYSKFKGPSI